MKLILKKIFTTKLLLKVVAILYAYFLWLIISQSLSTSLDTKLPIIIYNIPQQHTVKAPSYVNVRLTGKRMELRDFVSQSPSVNIDGSTFFVGDNDCPVLQEHIFLPQEIKLIDYKPSRLKIRVTSN